VLGGWNIEDYTYKSNLMNREGIIIPGMPNFSLARRARATHRSTERTDTLRLRGRYVR